MNVIAINQKFSTQLDCIAYLEKLRWGKVKICPYCKSTHNIPIQRGLRHHCYNCKRSFSVLVGTIFEDTRLPLHKFFVLVGLMLNARKGISASQLGRDVGITLRTSWYAAMRVRCAMVETITDLHGTLEADEVFLGGKPRKRNKRFDDSTAYLSQVEIIQPKRGRGTKKVPVAGFVERDGRVVTKMLENLTAQNLLGMLKRNVNTKRSTMITDDFRSYRAFDQYIDREVIKHSEKEYVRGNVHTNTIEGYWSIVKNGLRGQYHVLSKKYLPFYLSEFAYKYNRRNLQSIQFEAYMKDAVSEGKCLILHKPVKKVTKIVYPNKDKPPKAYIKKFEKANNEARKKRKKKKQKKAKRTSKLSKKMTRKSKEKVFKRKGK